MMVVAALSYHADQVFLEEIQNNSGIYGKQ